MKKNLMKYKGYYGSYSLSEEDGVFFGKIEFIKDLVNYEAETVSQLISAFHDAVEDYFVTCASKNKAPDKPFKGTFNVRIGEDLHEKIATSLDQNESLNSFIVDAVKKKLERSA